MMPDPLPSRRLRRTNAVPPTPRASAPKRDSRASPNTAETISFISFRAFRPILALLVAPALLAAQPATTGSDSPVAAPRWAHQASDVLPDPAVRYGTLPNGLRYALLRNATPPGEASLRLAFDTGSLNEEDRERGLAHFLEHAVLNGTKNVPEGEFVRRLERAGLRFGPDTNASTGWEHTNYKLDLPRADAALLSEALFLLREVAGEASLEPAAVDAERPIIQAERRSRDVPAYRSSVANMRHALAGLTLPDRLPIGTPETVAAITPAQLRDFYRRYYRPENAILVAVGDFDPAKVEAEIARRFGDWRPVGPAGARRPRGRLAPTTPVHAYAEAGLPWSVGMTWRRAPDLRPDSEALRRENITRILAVSIFNRRLRQIANSPNAPFIGAGLSYTPELAEAVGSTGVGAVIPPGGWRPALVRLEQEVRRFRRYGVTPAELAREIVEYRASYQSNAASADTRNTRAVAEQLVGAALDPKVFTHPRDALARFEAAAATLTPERVNALIGSTLFAGDGPTVSLSSPTPIPDATAQATAALAESAKVTVAAPQAVALMAWPYSKWGAPGRVASRASLGGADLGVTDVRFANGARLLVKPTAFDKDAVLVSVGFGGGAATFPRTVDPVALASIGPAMQGGGVGAYDTEELRQVLADRFWGADFAAGEDRFSLSGATRPADLGVQMEVLAAKLTDPAWRPSTTAKMRASADAVHDGIETQPGGVLGREAARLLSPDDRRDDLPSREVLKSVSPDAARALIAPVLASAPLTVVVVGDVKVEKVVGEVARTLGALPPRAAAPVPVHPPQFLRTGTPEPIRRTHRGGAEQAAALVRWATTDFHADPRAARAREFLAQIVQLRLTDEFREKQGATYGTSASSSASTRWPGSGAISASIQAPPDKLAAFVDGAKRIARALAAAGPTADEMQRVREPALAGLRRSRGSSNGYWLGQIADMAADPRQIAAFRSRETDLRTLTAAEVQAEARRYLTDEAAWSLVVVPETRVPTGERATRLRRAG